MALPLPNTTEVQIVRLTKALYNAAPGNTYLTAFEADADNIGINAFANWFASTVSTDAATLASTVVTNIGLTGAAATAGTAYLTAQFAANAGNYGKVILDAMNALSTLTSDATYGTAASTFNDSVATSYSYSINTSNTSTNLATLQTADEPSAVTGQTFTLTTSSDGVSGTSGDDTISGSYNASTGMTFGSTDTIDGGAGTDTLSVTIGTAAIHQAASLKNVETVSANFSAAGTVNLTGVTGVTTVEASASTAAAVFSGMGSIPTTMKVSNTSQNATFTLTDAALAGSTDSVSLTLNAVTGGTTTIAPTAATNGAETIAITSSGSANTVTLDDGASTSLSKLTVAGDQNLTLTTTPTTAATIDASTLTGALTYTVNSATAATVTGGSGNDSLTLGQAVNDSVNAGAGNDTVRFTANLTTADTINGGDGTDILSSTSALLTGYTAPTTATISNFETLRVTDALGAALTTASVQAGINTVDLDAGSGTFAVTMEAGSKTVLVGAANTGVLTVNDTGTATTDSLALTNDAAATDVFAGQNVVVGGFETVTISTSGTGAATTQTFGTIGVTADTGGTATVKFTGSNAVTTNAITAAVIDASGLTAASTGSTFVMGAAAVSVTSITGSAGNDTLVGDTSTYIDGGAGADGITGGANNDTLIGGDGNDSITSGAGNDSIDAGAGNDTLTLVGNLTQNDILNGGDGTDTLSVNNATLTAVNALAISAITTLNTNLSNVERLTVSDDLDQTSFDIARLDSINYITINDWAGAESLIGLTANTTVVLDDSGNGTNAADDLTLTLADASGASDAITISLVNDADNTDFGDVTIASIETLTVTTAEVTATSTAETFTLDLTSTGLSTLTITGTEELLINGVAVNAATINASGNTGAVNVLGGSANQAITGTDGADTIDGGAGADTITGGASTDTLSGGTGADSITGGEGADTILGGAGNDSIVLTETTAAVDRVQITYSEAGTHIDTVTGFTTGATSGDVISLDLTALELVSTSGGIFSTATNFEELNDGTDVSAAVATLGVITAANTPAAGTDIIALSGATFSTGDEVEDALEAGGAFALTVNANAANVNSAFFVVYSNGTDAKVAAVHIVAETADDTDFEAGNLNVIDLVTLSGVSSIGSTTFDSVNFLFV